MVKGHVRFIYLSVPTNVDVLVHNSLVSLKELLVLVSSPAPLTLGLLVVVDLVGVGVQLQLVLKLPATLAAVDSIDRGMDAEHVLPQGALVPHLGGADLALDWLDVVDIAQVIVGGQNPTNRTDPLSASRLLLTIFLHEILFLLLTILLFLTLLLPVLL